MTLILLTLIGCQRVARVDGAQEGVDELPASRSMLVFPKPSADGLPVFPFRVDELDVSSAVNITLPHPYSIEGAVLGNTATPRTRSSLPGGMGPVAATLVVRGQNQLENQIAHTDETGGFVLVGSEGEHTLTVLPDTSDGPLAHFAVGLSPDSSSLPIQLDEIVPIWGRVTQFGAPRANNVVRLVTPDGLEGPPTRTDSDGWYELHAQVGTALHVQVEGIGDGFDPVLFSDDSFLGYEGLRTDFSYAAVPRYTLSGRLQRRADGTDLRSVDFFLHSTSLTDFQEGSYVEIRGVSDGRGNIVTRAPPGEYILEILPGRETTLTASRTAVTVTGPTSVGTIALAPMTTIYGSVTSDLEPVPGTLISCGEVGYRHRAWSTVSDGTGSWSLLVADSEVICSANPPPDSTLALDRATFWPHDDPEVRFNLQKGTRISGSIVDSEGGLQEFTRVDIIDSQDGTLWGSTLSDASGRYSLYVR